MEERRKFLRIDDVMPVKYSKMSFKDPTDPKEGLRRNISGGGIKMRCKEMLPVGTILKLKFDLPKSLHPTSIFALGNVVWQRELSDSEKFAEEEKYQYEVGLSFISIEEKDRQKIVRYVLDKHHKAKLRERSRN